LYIPNNSREYVMTRLYRSETDKKIAGVCGGIAELQDVDPTIVRLILVALALISGFFPLTVGYIIAWAIVPKKSELYPIA
jgi:phage shock protein C